VKRVVLVIILIAAAIGAGVYWKTHHTAEAKPAEEKPPPEESHVSHDDMGRVVVKMDDEIQGNIGLLVEKPTASQLSPELKGYGKVMDPAPLAALLTELASAQAAYAASSRELERVKTLAGQGNASDRALKAVESTAVHDQIATQAVRDRLVLAWGKEVADREDLFALVQSLAAREVAVVRIDLPASETMASPPGSVRIFNLPGKSVEGEFLGMAANVDPQTLGRGFLFLVKSSTLRLVPGEAVTGFMKIPGTPIEGVIVPSQAVIRTEGAGWVYILKEGGDEFTRTGVALDHPVENGWFIAAGVTSNDYVVVSGAQALLSEESKASLKPD